MPTGEKGDLFEYYKLKYGDENLPSTQQTCSIPPFLFGAPLEWAKIGCHSAT